MKLTDEQKAIIAHRDGLSLTLAVAGAAKTTSILLRIGALVRSGVSPSQILLTTFSRLGAADMRKRAAKLGVSSSVEYRTLHSFAWGIIRTAFPKMKLPPSWFARAVVRKAIADFVSMESGARAMQPPTTKEVLGEIGCAKSALILPDAWTSESGERFPGYMEWAQSRLRPQALACATEMAYRRLEQDRRDPFAAGWNRLKGLVPGDEALDHDDAILLVAKAILQKADWIQKFEGKFQHVIVDEAQDNNRGQWELVKFLARTNERQVGDEAVSWKNLMVVADDSQCVAGDTFVWSRGGQVKVADLRPGDEVLAYRNGRCVTQTVRHVQESSWRWGLKITTSSGKSLTMSPNHKLWAYLPDIPKGGALVYLMFRRGLGFRVGVTSRGARGDGYNVFNSRACSEGADRMWVLDICKDRDSALFLERFYSLKYRTPTEVFNGTKRGIDQDRIDSVFREFGENGAEILREKNLCFDLPHWLAGSYMKHGRLRRTVRVNAHGLKGTTVTLEWSGSDLDAAMKRSGINPSRITGDRRLIRRYFNNYREAISFAKVVESASRGDVVSHRLSVPGRFVLQQTTASGIHAGMKVPVLNEDRMSVELEDVISVERVPGTFLDLDVLDASNFFGNGILSHNSIYSWRGAQPELLYEYMIDSGPFLSFFRLTTNFRSGGEILARSNGILKAIQGRLFDGELRLGRVGAKGEVTYDAYSSPREEAESIVDWIKDSIEAGRKPSEIAVLYRINASSGLLEMALIRDKIPYRVAGKSFFKRPDVVAALAYVALAVDENDEEAYDVVYRVPLKGLGREFLRLFPNYKSLKVANNRELTSRWTYGARKLLQHVEAVKDLILEGPVGLSRAISYVFENAGVKEHFQSDADSVGGVAGEGDSEAADDEQEEAIQTLCQCALSVESAEDLLRFAEDMKSQVGTGRQDDEGKLQDQRVTLSTVHRAKGLEFEEVFLMGLSRGLFPLARSPLMDELRLGYVAFTRAKDVLHLSCAADRNPDPEPSMLLELAGIVPMTDDTKRTLFRTPVLASTAPPEGSGATGSANIAPWEEDAAEDAQRRAVSFAEAFGGGKDLSRVSDSWLDLPVDDDDLPF